MKSAQVRNLIRKVCEYILTHWNPSHIRSLTI